MKKSLVALSVAMLFGVALAFLLTQPALMKPQVVPSLLTPDGELLIEYPVPGNPESVAVEAPGRVWFTLPPQNLIGRLVVTSTMDFSVKTYPVPTADSQPYDIDWADGAAWFTERVGNKIGRLDPETGVITEYPALTPGSSPTGIDVLAGNPTRIWFAERDADRLGTLVFTDTLEFRMEEVSLPERYAGAELQDVSVKGVSKIWFTAPGLHRFGSYSPGTYDPFDLLYVRDKDSGVEGIPWSIEAGGSGVAAWFTDRGLNRIVGYFPQTLSLYAWYALPTDNSGPNDLVVTGQYVWCTEELGERVVRATKLPRSVGEFQVGNGALGGIDADDNGHIWFAERDAELIGEWRAPYFRTVYLPLSMRF